MDHHEVSIEKLKFCGSVTAVAHARFPSVYSASGERSLSLWSNGGVLHWFDAASQRQNLRSLRVFEHSYVHEIKVYAQHALVVVFGNKSLSLLRYDDNDNDNNALFKTLFVNDFLDDLVLDAVLTTVNRNERGDVLSVCLLVGYAHNFYDEVEVAISSQGVFTWTLKKRHRCPDICALFSLTISVDPKDVHDVIVVSGNVFGKITLWKRSTAHEGTADDGICAIDTIGQVLTSIHLHEGVVFRVVWKTNSDGSRSDQLVSVSDDRSIRLWRVTRTQTETENATSSFSLSQLFVGWGHISRLWDVLFLDTSSSPSAADCALATCSEDGTIKLWNNDGQCVATLQGHCGSIWRIASIREEATNTTVLVSGGNDGSVKFWDVDFHRRNSPQNESSTANRILIPNWPVKNSAEKEKEEVNKETVVPAVAEEVSEDVTATESTVATSGKKKKKNTGGDNNHRRKNGVNSLRISPCGRSLVLIMVDGKVWHVSLSASSRDGVVTEHWDAVADMQCVVVQADVFFHQNEEGLCERFFVALCAIDGTAKCFSVSKEDLVCNRSREATVDLYDFTEWRPHPLKTVNIWFVPHFHCQDDSTKKNGEKSECPLILTATLQGVASLWQWQRIAAENTTVSLLSSVVTGKGEIVSSCLLCHVSTEKYLVLGDSRGGVNFYLTELSHSLPSTEEKASVSPVAMSPTQFFPYVHKSDPVCTLAGLETGLVSAGHDNFLAFFALSPAVNGSAPDNGTTWIWSLENSLTTVPVQTPDQIVVAHCSERERLSLYLCGYYGNAFIVQDIRRGLQLLRVEGGGWKRPHHSRLVFDARRDGNSLPAVLFACPAPVGKTETELQLFGHFPLPAVSSNSNEELSMWPLQLGVPSFSNVSNCTAIISLPVSTPSPCSSSSSSVGKEENRSLIVVGGEDCTMRAFSLSPALPETQLVMETSLTKNSSLKSVCAVGCGESEEAKLKGIVVGGGGKLLFYLWVYDYTRERNSFMPLRKVHAGSICSKSAQDHRILAVKALYVGREGEFEHFLLFFADSRGFFTVVDFQYNFSVRNENNLDNAVASAQQRVSICYQAEISQCPLLSCDAAIVTTSKGNDDDKFAMCVVGDTKGDLMHLVMPIKREKNGSFHRFHATEPVLLEKFTAHAMGTNSMSLRVVPTCTIDRFIVMTCSGGDDQSLSLTLSVLSFVPDEDTKEWLVSFEHAPVFRQSGAAGAALKGSLIVDAVLEKDTDTTVSLALRIISVAYDQRVSIWRATALVDYPLSSSFKRFPSLLCEDNGSNNKGSSMKRLCDSEESAISSVSANFSLQWTHGMMTHVMEVSHLCVTEDDDSNGKKLLLSVAGQGFQTFRVTF